MKKATLLILTTWLICNIGMAQYSETFDVPNKGILGGPCTTNDPTTCAMQDFAGVNWTLEGNLSGLIAADDNFYTVGGVLRSMDLDEEVCWVSPVLTMTGTASFSLDLTWLSFNDYDVSAVGSKDYIDVSYRIDGGAWITLANAVGGGPRTISYIGSNDIDGSITGIGATGLTGSTLQIRVCADANAAGETVTIDNVSAVNADDGSTPLVCDLVLNSIVAVNEDCTDANDGTITINATSTNGPINYSITGPVNRSNSTGVFTGLPPGMYSIALQDGSFAPGTCTASGMATIAEANDLTPPTATPPADVTVDCPADIPAQNTSLVTNINDNCFIPCFSEPWINEFHYDNIGTDVNEFVEVAGPAGLDLSIYSLYFYDGFDGQFYDFAPLTGTIPNQQNGYGTVAFSPLNIQNTMEGIALVKNGTTVIEFISYEGVVTATDGPANGLTSVDIGVAESNDVTPTNGSLGRVGASNRPTGFNFAVLTQTQGALNTGQTITSCPENTPTVAFLNDVNNGGEGTSGDPYIVTRTYRVTDANGNTADITQTLTANNCCTAPSVTVSAVSTPLCPGSDADFQFTGTASAEVTYNINGGSEQTLFLDISGMASLNIMSPAGNQTLNLVSALDTTENCTALLSGFATVVLEDTAPPFAACQNVTVQLDNTGTGSITTASVNNGSSDNCGPITLGLSQTAFDCDDTGANIVILTATDASMNSATCTTTVTVVDNILPTAVCQDITVFLDGAGNSTITSADLDGGSTDNCGGVNLNASTSSFTCADVGPNNVTLTVTDASLNFNTCLAVVTVVDTVSPVAICQDVTLQLDMAGDATLMASAVDGGSSDNCGISSLDLSADTFTCADIGSNTVTLTVTDVNSNVNTCAASVTVEDNIPPTALCQNTTVQLDGTGQGSISIADINNGSSDNCGIMSLDLSQTNFTCSDIGANTVTLTVTDESNNTTTCTATVTVEDNILPTAVCQDITVFLDGAGNSSITAADLDGGSTDNCGITNLNASVTSFTCANVGPNNVTFTITDTGMNTDFCTSIVTVVDTVSPVAICQDVTLQLDMAGDATLMASAVDGGSSDNCGISSLDLSADTFTCADIGSNTVTLTVTDVNSNVSSCSANVTVVDNISPTALCVNTTVELDASGQGSISTADIDNGSSDNCGIKSLGLSQTDFTCSDVGTNTVTLTVTDESDNTAVCTATVTVEDNLLPVALCAGQITVQLDGNGMASLDPMTVDAGSTDNCGIAMLDLSTTSFDCTDIGSNLVTLTVTDVNGNSDFCISDIIIEDNISPTVVCENITLQLDAMGQATLAPSAINNNSTDNCGIFSLEVSTETFDCTDIGFNLVFLTVTDVNNNVSSCSANVTVEDNVLPVAICQNTVVELDAMGEGSITAADLDAGSTDNCGIMSLDLSETNFTCSDVGPNIVTLSVVDENNNSSSCTSTVTVEDNILPTAICQDITVQLDGNGSAGITSSTINDGSFDNCGIAGLTVSPAIFDCDDIGNNTVTLMVTDVNNNTNSCTASVTVEDNVAPSALCQDVTVQLGDMGTGSIAASDIDNESADNCGILSLEVSTEDFSCDDVGSNPVVLTVTDVNNNVNTCSATVAVEDNILPTISCVNSTISFNGEDELGLEGANMVTATDDNCGVSSVTYNPATVTTAQIGETITVTATVTDVNGNTAQCSAEVFVSGLPDGWVQDPDGVNCTEGNYAEYDFDTEVFILNSTNCYYSSPFNSDQTAFIQRTLCGNGSITVEVTGITGGFGWAGVVMRENNSAGARKIQLSTNTNSNFSRREVRSVTNGPAMPQQFPSFNRHWLRIVRQGNFFIGYTSPNGINWFQVMAANIPMGPCVEMGMFVTNYNQNGTVVATFGNVDFTEPQPTIPSPGDYLVAQEAYNYEIYPNPASEGVFLDLKEYTGKPVHIELHNMNGQMVKYVELSIDRNATQYIDMAGQAPGLYIVKVRSENQEDVIKRFVLTSN